MTAPFWTTTRAPSWQRSRIETCAWIRQSGPMIVPAPTTTCASITVRAPTRAPAPMTAYGPTATPVSSTASSATTAVGCTPVGSVDGGASAAAARAKARYGSRARSTTHGAVPPVGPRITADARVDATCAAYDALARNDTSPASAVSSAATRHTSTAPSPSSVAPIRAARSCSVMCGQPITQVESPAARRTPRGAAGPACARDRAGGGRALWRRAAAPPADR